MHVIYGGTFDPVHHGHLRLALEISDRLGVEYVSLVPCHIPPHRGQTGASSGQRLALLRLAVANEPQLRIDDRELAREGASYTADTLRQLRAELGPREPLVMVVGTDAFAGFDPNVVAEWGEPEVQRLLANPGIIRHRGKIEATISNARVWQDIEARQGFDRFLWDYVEGRPLQTRFASQGEVPPQTPLSTRISKDLKKAGFRFCGPTIVYAFMEAVGMVNDHVLHCPCHAPVAALADA